MRGILRQRYTAELKHSRGAKVCRGDEVIRRERIEDVSSREPGHAGTASGILMRVLFCIMHTTHARRVRVRSRGIMVTENYCSPGAASHRAIVGGVQQRRYP